jgi:hypothetical protein
MWSVTMFVARFIRVSRNAGLAALVLLATCAAQAQSSDTIRVAAAPAPQPIALKFAWGDALDANVLAVREEFQTRGDSERVSKLEARFHLHATREGDRYALTFSDLTMSLDGQPVTEGAQPGMLGPVTGLVLSYDIASNGDFIGLRDFDRLQSFTERSYLAQNDRLRREDRPSQRDSDRALKSGTSPEVLQLDASRTWGALAGLWAGLKLTEGQPLASESAVTVPVINSPLTLRTTFEIVRGEECAKGERRRSCVRLRATSQPDPTQLAAALERLKQRSGDDGPTSGSMNVEDRIELLTDPETLKPRWAQWIRGADISGIEDGTERVQGRQSTRTTMTFNYSGKR